MSRRLGSQNLPAVLSALARMATRLCDVSDVLIFRAEDDQLRLVARHGSIRTTRRVGDTVPTADVLYGLALLRRRTLHVRDLAVAVRTRFKSAEWTRLQKATGVRTLLAMPMLVDGAATGVIVLRRTRVRPFTRWQIALTETFADQAALAIENVRLRGDLAHAQGEVTESLDREAATSEILRVISSSPSDLQPVFDAIVQRASRLCGGEQQRSIDYAGWTAIPSRNALRRIRVSRAAISTSGVTDRTTSALARWMASSARTGSSGNGAAARSTSSAAISIIVHSADARVNTPKRRSASAGVAWRVASSRTMARRHSSRVSREATTASALSSARRISSPRDSPSSQPRTALDSA
jgi:hypothetical protein